MSTVAASQLDTVYPLDAATIRRFRDDGFIRLPNVLSPETLAGSVATRSCVDSACSA